MGWKQLVFLHESKTSVSHVKNMTTSQPYGLLTPRTPTSSITVAKDAAWESETDRGNMYCSYSGDGVGYGMFTLELCVFLVRWAFFLLNLWSPRCQWSRPPLQGLAEMSPVPMYSSTAHDLFSPARTSSSARFSPAVNPSSSNSDIMTSTANNSTVLSFWGRHLIHRYLRICRHKPIEFAVPKSNLTRLSKVEVIRNVLEILSNKKAKLAPLDFLLDAFDQSSFSFVSCPIL